MHPEERLRELGLELPEVKKYHPAMAPGSIVGNLLYLSGSTPPAKDGVAWNGRVGETYSVEQGYEAAKMCGLLQLAQAKVVLGDLGRIKRVIKVLGMVNCAPGFAETSQVIHGHSELMHAVFGEAGVHARSAVGMQALPGNVPVEVETIFEID